MDKPLTKDALLKQADGLRDLARRARRLAASSTTVSDQGRLEQYAKELDENASRLERDGADAKAAGGQPSS